MNKPSPKFSERIAQRLVQWRWNLLVIAIAIGGASYLTGKKMTFDNSIEGMFATQSQELHDFQRLKQIFGGSEVVMVVYDDPQLFSPPGFEKLEKRSQQLAEVEGVQGVLSLTEINLALRSIAGPSQSDDSKPSDDTIEPILDPENKLASDFLELFEGYTHGKDRRTVAIVCLLESLEKLNISRFKSIRALRAASADWSNAKVTGEPVLVADGFRFIRADGKRLNRMSLGLMAVVIIICFRSIRWVLIPIAVYQLSLWMTLSLLVLLGWKLTMVSSMLSAIVAVISVATVVHFTVRYRELRLSENRSRVRSVELAMSSLLVPITWTCLTTAAGFAALTLAKVEPVKDFGWMMTIGSLSVIVSFALLVPGLSLLGNLDSDPQHTWGEGRLQSVLNAMSRSISRWPIAIGLVVALVVGWIAAGGYYLEVETDFTKNFRSDSEIIKSYDYVEKKLGGAGVLDVVISDSNRMDLGFLQRVEKLQDELERLTIDEGNNLEPALTHVMSYASADRIIRKNLGLKLGLSSQIEDALVVARFQGLAQVMPSFAAQMRTTQADEFGQYHFRVMLRTSQQKSARDQQQLIAKVRATAEKHFPNPATSQQIDTKADLKSTTTTGFFVLLANLVNSVLEDQAKTFIGSIIFISIVMLLAFRSLRLVAIGIVPNVLPIVALLGLLGWTGTKMNMGAAMIAAVSLGLSIDGTIHYLTLYGHIRRSGHRVASSIERVQFRIGRAVTYSTMALVVGFGSLCSSQFIPTVFFGGLVGLSMLGGLMGNLIVLPVLLTLFDKRTYRTKSKLTKTAESNGAADPDSGLHSGGQPLPGPHAKSTAEPT